MSKQNCQYINDCRVFSAHHTECYMETHPNGSSQDCPVYQVYRELEELISDAERNHLIKTSEPEIKIERGWRAG